MKYSETVTLDRNYYFDISGEKVPNEEDMLAFLLDEGILFSGNDYDYQADNNVTLKKYLKRIEKNFNLKKL
jgi:hypothetical protein